MVKAWLAEAPGGGGGGLSGIRADLNPDEWVWSWTKYGRLSNLAAYDTDELRDEVLGALIDLKEDRAMLKSFINHVNLPLQL